MERMLRSEQQGKARRPAAEPDERMRSSALAAAQGRGVARGPVAQAVRPRHVTPLGLLSGVSTVVQRLGDPVILAELPYWDMRDAYGYPDEVAHDDTLMQWFRSFDTLADMQQWLGGTFGQRLAVPLPLTAPATVAAIPAVTPLPGPLAVPSTASPTVAATSPSVSSNSNSSSSSSSSSSVPAPSFAPPQASSPVPSVAFGQTGPTGPSKPKYIPFDPSKYPSSSSSSPSPLLSYGSAAAKGALAPAPQSSPSVAVRPSARAQAAIAKFAAWKPGSEGHSGYKDLKLTPDDLDDIESSVDTDKYYVIRGPGDGVDYAGFNQLKIVHGKMPKIGSQSPTFHISYEKS